MRCAFWECHGTLNISIAIGLAGAFVSVQHSKVKKAPQTTHLGSAEFITANLLPPTVKLPKASNRIQSETIQRCSLLTRKLKTAWMPWLTAHRCTVRLVKRPPGRRITANSSCDWSFSVRAAPKSLQSFFIRTLRHTVPVFSKCMSTHQRRPESWPGMFLTFSVAIKKYPIHPPSSMLNSGAEIGLDSAMQQWVDCPGSDSRAQCSTFLAAGFILKTPKCSKLQLTKGD